MKLALAVVYMVDARHGALLDLHLDRIARHTRGPYTIYGTAVRLLPQFRSRLESRSDLNLLVFPPTELRGSFEHSYYLERLIEAAVADGATHVATLHVDSFPVADGWNETLAARLSGGRRLAIIDGVDTACLFFPREFYLEHRPPLLVPAEAQTGANWNSFLRTTKSLTHSGVGYVFAAWSAGTGWHSMIPRRRGRSGGPAVYDDLVFHLKGAVRLAAETPGGNGPLLRAIGQRRFKVLSDTVKRTRMRLRSAVSPAVRAAVRRLVPHSVDERFFAPERRWMAAGNAAELDELLADPDRYLESMLPVG